MLIIRIFLIAEHIVGQWRWRVPSGWRNRWWRGGDEERRRAPLAVPEFAILEQATFGRGRGTWGQRGRHRARFVLVLEPGPCSRVAAT